jgi:hypothetical protein
MVIGTWRDQSMRNALPTAEVLSPGAGQGRPILRLAVLSLMILAGCGEDAATPSPTTRLVEAGWSFGFCLGACNGVLMLNGDDLSYQVTSRERDQVFAQTVGELTSTGAARLNALVGDLPTQLLERYGCPDCADAGAAYVVVERDSSGRRSEYEYPNPPGELAGLDTFLRELMDALGSCRSTAEVTVAGSCVPLPQ